MAQSPLSTVEEWQRKATEVSTRCKDGLVSVVSKGFDAMAVMLTKDPDTKDVKRVLAYLNVERSIALEFDKDKDDSLRDLVYGLLDSMHVSLNEWNDERNQKKETGEIFTQTEEFPSVNSLKIAELEKDLEKWKRRSENACRVADSAQKCADLAARLLENKQNGKEESEMEIEKVKNEEMKKREIMQRENDHLKEEVNGLIMKIKEIENAKIPDSSPTIPCEPKEEPIDIHESLPSADYQIWDSEFMRDENMFKEEEMDNDNNQFITAQSNLTIPDSLDMPEQTLNSTRYLPFNFIEGPIDFSYILPRDNQTPLNILRDEIDFKEEEMPNIGANSGMEDATGDLFNEFNNDGSVHRTIEPSASVNYQMNFDNGPGEEDDILANDLIDNEGGEEEEAIVHPANTPKDTPETVKVEKRKISSRNAPRPARYNDLMEDSDGDCGLSTKKSRFNSTRGGDNKRRSFKRDDETEDVTKKIRVAKKNDTELECPECEFRSLSVQSWVMHLRNKHSTTPKLAGLALLCKCGNESLGDAHSRVCDYTNTTVIRKRNGPIERLDNLKATPQCVLCEIYPKTAYGYLQHLRLHHKSNLVKNGIYLKCSCGLEFHSGNNHNKHLDECNPRQFTLHKLNDE